MFAEMASEQPAVDVVAAAAPETDKEADGLVLVEILDTVGASGLEANKHASHANRDRGYCTVVFHPLVPAKAGTQGPLAQSLLLWVPAFAGTSGGGAPRQSDGQHRWTL